MINSTEGMMEFLSQQIQEKELTSKFIDTKVWKTFKGVIDRAIKQTNNSMRSPDKLEFKCGQLDAFHQMLDWADRIEKDLKILSLERENILRGV